MKIARLVTVAAVLVVGLAVTAGCTSSGPKHPQNTTRMYAPRDQDVVDQSDPIPGFHVQMVGACDDAHFNQYSVAVFGFAPNSKATFGVLMPGRLFGSDPHTHLMAGTSLAITNADENGVAKFTWVCATMRTIRGLNGLYVAGTTGWAIYLAPPAHS
ncbi:MAG TPA: hypothetical protein VLF91_00295 [Candidatus Saccharimonadales bacterium]|nr:hypothetical protein [Candidatus Saccharimonadales bacterium]